MQLKNKNNMYGFISKTLHWTTALLIFGLLSMGFFMADLPVDENKFKIYALHKSFGLLVLLLFFVRVVWHIISKKPKSLDTHQKWEKFLAHTVHYFLYFVLFAMPLSGWVMSSAGDFSVGFFDIPMPDLVAKNKDIFEFSKEIHEIMALVIIMIVGLHAVGAFKHHFIDRDVTLARMTRENIGFLGGVFLVILAGVLMAGPLYFVARDLLSEEAVDVDQEAGEVYSSNTPAVMTEIRPVEGAWVIDFTKSKIGFEATQYNQPFSGSFNRFEGLILFDSEDLVSARADITIDIGSISTGAQDRDVQALSAEWFDAQVYPQAKFITQRFEKKADNAFVAYGDLSIRGVNVPVALPFTLDISDENGHKHAKMVSELSLNRLDFGIGQGQWKSTDAIGGEIKITVTIEATK